MSLTVTRARVKEKCGIAVSTYDATIDNLIAEMLPVIQYAIGDSFIADTGNAGLQATLNLGAAEVVTGEFLDQLAREPGALETITVLDLSLRPSQDGAAAVKAQGWNRLGPFMKSDLAGTAGGMAAAGGERNQESET